MRLCLGGGDVYRLLLMSFTLHKKNMNFCGVSFFFFHAKICFLLLLFSLFSTKRKQELQQERDLLQDKLTEQMMKITSLQSRLDEQRHRAEEVHRQGTSDLNIRVHDLQSEITTLRETISSQTKQIATLKSHLEESKKLIDRQEAELTQIGPTTQSDRYETELRVRSEEIQRLKDKIKNEMINKLALPDLMETMLADKNDEIDHLKDQLGAREKEMKLYLDLNLDENQIRQLQKTAKELLEGKASARTLSDIVSISSELDEPDVERKCVAEANNEPFSFNIPHGDMAAGQMVIRIFFFLIFYNCYLIGNLSKQNIFTNSNFTRLDSKMILDKATVCILNFKVCDFFIVD